MVSEYVSSLETRLRYVPTDCLETFPFPAMALPAFPIADQYHDARLLAMTERQEGLTKIYNRVNDPLEDGTDIANLRALYVELDKKVASAYGWQNLALDHGFHQTKQGIRFTISEAARREVLDRLLTLNHQRHAEEQAEKASMPISASAKRGRKQKATDEQITLDL